MTKKLIPFVTPNNWFFYIGIALIFQLFYLYIFNSFENPNGTFLYFQKGDGIQYINYCENFYRYGIYFEGTINRINSYTNRMPGMCVLYLPIRLFFNAKATLSIFVFLQAVFASIASYLLALIAKRIFKNNYTFYFTFILYATSTYCANYLHLLYTESLALSTLITAVYFLVEFINRKKIGLIILFSLFLTWCVFLRPFISPFILFAGFYFFYLFLKKKINLGCLIAYFFPILILFGLWTVRNFNLTKQIVPLQSGSNWFEGDPATNSRVRFIKSFGLGWVWWDSRSEHTWFLNDESLKVYKIKRPSDSLLTQRKFCNIFSSQLTLDSLKKARSDYWQSIDTTLSKTQRDSFSQSSSIMLERFIKYKKDNNPIDYYVTSRLIILTKLLNQPHGASIKSFKYPFNVLLTFGDAVINYLVILFGVFSIILFAFFYSYRKIEYILICSFPLFIFILFAFILKGDESRQITLAYPWLILTSIEGIRTINRSKYSKVYYLLLFIILGYGGLYSVINDINW